MNGLLIWWQSSWRARGANEEDHARHVARRLHDMSQLLPVSIMASVMVLLLSQFLAWEHSPWPGLRWLWNALLLTNITLDLWVGWRCSRRMPAGLAGHGVLAVMVLNLTLTGLGYGLVGMHLLGLLDEGLRLVTLGVLAAVLAGGAWLFAAHAACGLAWVLAYSLGLAVGASQLAIPGAPLMVLLTLPYAFFLAAMVLVSAQQRLSLLAKGDEIERQRGMLDLLLRDFEADASDWLWEIDALGRLQHVSVHLAQATERPVAALRGQPLLEVLRSLGAENLEGLSLALSGPRPFSEFLLPWRDKAERRWWRLKARPQFDEAGEPCGWRGIASDVTTLRRNQEELTRLATRDTLTGLANRHLFYQQLAERLPQGCAVMLIDLDNFKQINDSLGHAAGDALLQELARRWQPLVPEGALLARLGGDEFGLLLHIGQNVDALAHELAQALRFPIRVAESDLHVGISLGTACAPLDALQAERLLGLADVALYAAKAGGRGRLIHFRPELEENAERRLHLSSDLRQALRNAEGGLFTVYQPKSDLRSGCLVGFEALTRWHHPRLGMVPPAEFIPVAEESGLVLELGERVLRQACADAMQWPGTLQVAVNVSALQVERGDLVKMVESALKNSDLAPHRLELELTESAFLDSGDKLLALLGELRALGVRVALDDFGTGYSSLAYLQALPLDTLKIDRSFIMDLTDEGGPAGAPGKPSAIVRTIIQLADAIGAKTVAEGVETEAQRQRLIELGCAIGQGYLFSRPLGAREATWVANNPGLPSLLPGQMGWRELH